MAVEEGVGADGSGRHNRGPMTAVFRKILRWTGLALLIFVALLAAAVATSLTVDLGPVLRARAERAGSERIERSMRMGRLSIWLARGAFVVEDLVIEGLAPTDRPFLTAKRIVISMSWRTLVRREFWVESVEMTDWQMLVEKFPGGQHSFPKLAPVQSSGPKRFTTTLHYLHAYRGVFTYEDHGAWSTVARNLDITITKLRDYRGQASFSGGTVAIQSYVPMWADMRAQFKFDGPRIHFDRIDLRTDGAESLVTGDVDLSRWPEMFFNVRSRVHFPRMREIFFARDTFSLSGDGDFVGTFHLYKGGRELAGDFTSDLAGVNAYRFGDLRGSLIWLPGSFEVNRAGSRFYGGTTKFTYSMAPIGAKTPAIARFDTVYEDVDLAEFTDFLQLKGIRLAGRAKGHNLLEWPLGRFSEHRGEGSVVAEPPAGARLMGRSMPPSIATAEAKALSEAGPFDPIPFRAHVPIGGEFVYEYGPEWVDIRPSHMATAGTSVEFEGRTAWGQRSRIPFHAISADWQESDRLLAGIVTAFGSPTRAVPVGGSGEFDGVMLNAFTNPRIEGTFAGEQTRAWDVTWGSARGKIVVENSYVDVTNSILREGSSEIRAEGRFSLGHPRRDGGEEINARISIVDRPLADLKHAFAIDDYRVDGTVTGEYHLYGKYNSPFGFGRITINNGSAYGEPFDSATGGLRFEGAGVRMDGVQIRKGDAVVTGAAYIEWDGTYSFNGDGRRMPVESIATFSYENVPLSGLLSFSASGTGSFNSPRYEVRGRIEDLFVRDEGIGQVTVRLGVRNESMTIELEAASPRLAISGIGRVALTPEADAELTFRFTGTSLDPYVRVFEPRLSPFTTAVATGGFRVVGRLRDIDQLVVDGTVDQLSLSLFDYKLHSDGQVKISLERHVLKISRMKLAGEGTELDLAGEIDLHDERIAVRATGDANLGILQGFFRDIRSSGEAALVADIRGALSAPQFSGSASITNGRIRHFSLPHSLEAINGRVSFDAGGINMDDVVARMGGGDVRIGGHIALKGYVPGQMSMTARGEAMRVRYPEGFRSVIDADLALRGDFYSPVLTGTINVKSALWVKRFDAEANLLDLAGGGASTSEIVPTPSEETQALRFDVRIEAPSSVRIESRTARIVSSADLTLRGTYDRPLLFGRADIERGEVLFEGNRYLVTRGTVDFANPVKIEPFVDVEAETHARVPGQTYRIMFHATGTVARFNFELSSDPPLPTVDILALLFGDVRDPQNAPIRALQSQSPATQELIKTRAARLLASPISSEVGRVVEEAFGIDTVQITPSLGDPSAQQSSRLNPTARLTIGKRISDKVFITFSRGLTSSNRDQIILVEYDQSDRLAWVLTQNEDRTYALDFRVRHVF